MKLLLILLVLLVIVGFVIYELKNYDKKYTILERVADWFKDLGK